jgi:flavodoxin
MDKKILVVYYSRTGNTERVARDLASRLGADIEKITDKKKRSGLLGILSISKDIMKQKGTEIEEIQKNPAGYDIVAIGTPVWGPIPASAVSAYLEKTKADLPKAVFFTTSGSSTPENTVAYLEKIAGKKAVYYFGFNSEELKDAGLYESKISSVVENFKKI